ncbi:MAG: D-Ala-D-Ala carboxypeptidase family metallohydrolase [Caldilineaceae bacterium]
MHLSPHFTLEEMTFSQTAARRGIDNTPTPEALEALKLTAQGLEAVRIRLGGAPILVSSGYRSPELNAAIGGSRNSQHMRGEAADFTAPGFGTPRMIVDALADSGVAYDQLILEFGRWAHISFVKTGARRHALVIDGTGTRPLMA